MSRACVFCGKPPEIKNNEHILPQWLLELTGDPKRVVTISYNWSTNQPVKFSYNSFKVPSCTKCNTNYSDLENQAKLVVEKILLDDFINKEEIITLLDWFDKIRIGVWIAHQYLSDNLFQIKPNFYIDSRVRTKDRLLIINDFPNDNKGLTPIGTNTPMFHSMPSCFALVINRYSFLNISSDFLISYNLGFPFPNEGIVLKDDRRTAFKVQSGRERIKYPFIRSKLITPNLIIAQPIIHPTIRVENDEIYSSSYVKENCINFEKGMGDIFIEYQGSIEKLEDDDEVCLSTRNEIVKQKLMSIDIQTLELQNYLKIKELSILKYESDEQEKKDKYWTSQFLKFNISLIKDLKKKYNMVR